MQEKIYHTSCGPIHYWVNKFESDRTTIVFLPGLTADHRLFAKQIRYFKDNYNVFVWDAPGHASSWPFRFDFSLLDKAGSCLRYNREWHKHTGIRLEWIKDAGHNSNTDQPDIVNSLIEDIAKSI